MSHKKNFEIVSLLEFTAYFYQFILNLTFLKSSNGYYLITSLNKPMVYENDVIKKPIKSFLDKLKYSTILRTRRRTK